MDNENLVKNWQHSILEVCKEKLGRDLTCNEKHFVMSRAGFMALEIIEDTVKSLDNADLEGFLNSDN